MRPIELLKIVIIAAATTVLNGCIDSTNLGDAEFSQNLTPTDGSPQVSSTAGAPESREVTCASHQARPVRGVRSVTKNATAALNVATFNAALAPGFEALSVERAPRVIESLAALSANLDVLCVQEFWDEGHFGALKSQLSELPYSLRMPARAGTGDCSEAQFVPLVSCLAEACTEASPTSLVSCALTACSPQISALSPGCLGCVMNHLDGLEACLGTGEGPTDPAIFGGAFDTGLFSRYRIEKSSFLELSSYFVRVSVMHAKISVPKLGAIDAFCTHLGSPLGIVEYSGEFGSWQAEQYQQVEELLAFVKQENRGQRPVLLLGDFNTGPATVESVGVWTENYQRILREGFDDVYASRGNGACTYCANTTFRDETATSELLDHVFSSGLSTTSASSKRLFVDPVALGESLPPFNLSDHFGLAVTFTGKK